MIGAPLAVWLMGTFASGGVPGVSLTLVVMGAIYFVVMSAGAFSFRVAPAGWRPRNWQPAPTAATAMITQRHVHLHRAWRTPQFWLIWGVLFLNVTAGIAVIAMASPMLQDVFGARLLGVDATTALSAAQKAAIAAAAAGLVGPDQPLQQRRAALLGLAFRQARRKTTTSCSSSSASCFTVCCRPGDIWAFPPCSWRRLHHPHPVRRRFRHPAGLSRRHLRHPDGWRDPRPVDHRLVGRRRRGSGHHRGCEASPARPWRTAEPRVRPHALHHGRPAVLRPRLQSLRQAGA